MVEVTIQSVRINLATQQRVVILKARNQERYLVHHLDSTRRGLCYRC